MQTNASESQMCANKSRGRGYAGREMASQGLSRIAQIGLEDKVNMQKKGA